MNRETLKKYILETYSIESDQPWSNDPDSEVFRHRENKRWFAIVMRIKKNKLGISETDTIDVVNFKCDPNLIGSLRNEAGFYPAYHMSKKSWITAALDDSAADECIKMLIEMSYTATR